MKKVYILAVISILALGIQSYAADASTQALLDRVSGTAVETKAPADNFNYSAYAIVNPLDVVARPNFYLNKNIKVTGKFDKFSTLGLDYEPAMRSSDKYIAFLIQRPDVSDHNLPLSEMKCFLPREEAEKYIELNSGDRVEFYGTVFSNALGDIWVDVKKFNSLEPKKEEPAK